MANSRRDSARKKSLTVAFCGMAAGLSVVIMLLGGVIPVATYAVPMLCGLLLLPILLEFGEAAAWATFAATAALALLLGFDKEAAFFYLFLGDYPLVKWKLDRLKPRAWRLAAKILLIAAAMGAMYALLWLLFPLSAMTQEFRDMGTAMTGLFLIAMVGCMLLFDRLLPGMVMLYANRIRPRLTFLRR